MTKLTIVSINKGIFMLNNYVPTLEAPDNDSPEWYKNFHNSFYLSQLVNTVLLSYMKTFIEMVQKDGLLTEKKDELLERGALTQIEESEYLIDDEKVYALDVELFLEEIIENFKQKSREMNNMFSCIGVNTGNYLDRKVDIDLPLLLKSAGADNWYEIVKGFLNVWEFLFLFSITESSLRKLSQTKTINLISELNKKYPEVATSLEENHKISMELSNSIWEIFTAVRNIYSHTHGVISISDQLDLLQRANKFRIIFDKCFHEPTDSSSFILSHLMVKSDNLFKENEVSIGKFYFLGDSELNIFRNYVSEFMTELSKVDKAASA